MSITELVPLTDKEKKTKIYNENERVNATEDIKQILKNLPDVVNMESPKGIEVKNQFKVYGKDFTLFISYRSPIAMFKSGKVYIFKNWDYSKTTGKYRNIFLNETKAETLKKLKSGEYIAVDFEVTK